MNQEFKASQLSFRSLHERDPVSKQKNVVILKTLKKKGVVVGHLYFGKEVEEEAEPRDILQRK